MGRPLTTSARLAPIVVPVWWPDFVRSRNVSCRLDAFRTCLSVEPNWVNSGPAPCVSAGLVTGAHGREPGWAVNMLPVPQGTTRDTRAGTDAALDRAMASTHTQPSNGSSSPSSPSSRWSATASSSSPSARRRHGAVPTYLTLDEATQANAVDIHELGAAPYRRSRSRRKDQPVVIFGGDTIVGGKQNRIVNVTIWLTRHADHEDPRDLPRARSLGPGRRDALRVRAQGGPGPALDAEPPGPRPGTSPWPRSATADDRRRGRAMSADQGRSGTRWP